MIRAIVNHFFKQLKNVAKLWLIKGNFVVDSEFNVLNLKRNIYFLNTAFAWRKSAVQRYHSPLQANHLTYGQTVPTLPQSRDYSANARRDINASTLSSFKYYNTAKTARHPPPPSYEMYPTNRKSVPPAIQTSMYPYSDTSSAYNTVNHCQSSKDHIYESTFATGVPVAVPNDKSNDDSTSEHNYFVPESSNVTVNWRNRRI